MSKKRRSTPNFKRHKKTKKKHFSYLDRKNHLLSNLLLSILYNAPSPLSLSQVYEKIPEQKYDTSDINTALNNLIQDKIISKDNKKQFRVHKKAELYEGTLVQHPKGFGFVTVTKGPQNGPPLKRDAFVSPSQMGEAHHGDTVLIKISRIRDDDRPEASVIKVLSQGTNRIGGTYRQKGREHLVYPDDRRFPFVIRLHCATKLQIKNGDGVIAQFERTDIPSKFLQGKILEVLGPIDNIDTQMRLVVEQYQLPHRFNDEVVREVEMLDESFSVGPQREDLRGIDHLTIDCDTAKDFDDAICVIKTPKGYRLFVSIADVSHFVSQGSEIDNEAYSRGTSIYFPGRVIPMLPEKLSNDLCSLVPHKDRFTVSAILDFNRSGQLLAKRFCRSIICSRQRFTYNMVARILIDKDPVLRETHQPLLAGLQWAEELANLLQKRRKKRGSIDFDLPEAEFTLSPFGEIESITRSERNSAHQIIEECMLAANEAAAEYLNKQLPSAIFRVHEPPDLIKAEEFQNFVKNLGLQLSPFKNEPSWFAEVLRKSKGTHYQYIVNSLLLRSMKQARYADKNIGHFGLATVDYTHFTSPIRRYPDLIVHRLLLSSLEDNSQEKKDLSKKNFPDKADIFLSARERTAVTAERDMNDRLKARYMKKRIGESFEAIISGVTENALYVEIQNLCISGSIPVEALFDDYYLFDSKKYRLFGEITGKTHQLGDTVQVTVVDVDLFSNKIQFALGPNTPL